MKDRHENQFYNSYNEIKLQNQLNKIESTINGLISIFKLQHNCVIHNLNKYKIDLFPMSQNI